MECVRSVRYSTGWIFEGRRGLRQRDPLSLSLFVLVMDYSTRSLLLMSRTKAFSFHPKCKRLGIINLCFADNLMILCKPDDRFLEAIKEALITLAETTRLEANPQKSQIFIGGLKDDKKGMELGNFTIHYLGVPLASLKLG